MGKNHIKRIAMPKTWTTQEKKRVYWVARPNPGAHSLHEGMPLVLVLREMLKLGDTAREVRQILNHKTVLVDGVRRRDHKFNVGLMDVISIPDLKENFRITFNKHRKLSLVKIDDKEAKEKICKIKGKGLYNGKTQLRLSDGRNLIADKGEYKTGDSVVLAVPDQKIQSHIKFEKGALVLLTHGKKIGLIGTVENIKDHTITIKSKDGEFETLKEYCFVIGKGKPSLKIE